MADADDLDAAAEVVLGRRGTETLETPGNAFALEAIILEELRPAWFIKRDVIEIAITMQQRYAMFDGVHGN